MVAAGQALGLSFRICKLGRTLPLFLGEMARCGVQMEVGSSWKLSGVAIVPEAEEFSELGWRRKRLKFSKDFTLTCLSFTWRAGYSTEAGPTS